MLELRYNTATKEPTAWCGDERQFGNLQREGHTVIILDIAIPDKPLDAWLFDNDKLIPNPSYVELEPVMDYKAEILKLKDEIKKLKVK